MKDYPAVELLLELVQEVDLHGNSWALEERLRNHDLEGALEICREAMAHDQELISPESPGGARAGNRQNWYALRMLEARITEVGDAIRRRKIAHGRLRSGGR